MFPLVDIKLTRAGPASTLQDLGRIGSLNLGVCQTGAADSRLLKVANALVGNEANAACIEFSLLGPSFKAGSAPIMVAVAGDVDVKLNGRAVSSFTSFVCEPDDQVVVGALKSHAYAYVAVAGGFDTALLYGSRSTHARAGMGGFEGRNLKDGDCVPVGTGTDVLDKIARTLPQKQIEVLLKTLDQFHVVLGPQDDAFDELEIQKFVASTYSVTRDTDRMGMRLDGPAINHIKGADILSDGIAPGSIQVPGSGLPIILLAERQTIGGYTKIATVVSSQLGLLSQLLPSASVKFVATTPAQSIEITRKAQKQLDKMIASIRDNKPEIDPASLLSQNLISGVVFGDEVVS